MPTRPRSMRVLTAQVRTVLTTSLLVGTHLEAQTHPGCTMINMHNRVRHATPVMVAAKPDTESGAGPSALTKLSSFFDDDRGSALDAHDGLDASVIIVGAGAAGIGCAVSLTGGFGLDPARVLLLERGTAMGTSVNSTFRPEEMRFISPSFELNSGLTNFSFDLNSVVHQENQRASSSPAHTLQDPPRDDQKHQAPEGAQYADYLDELFELARLRDRVQLRSEVLGIDKVPGERSFDVHVRIEGEGLGGEDGVQAEERTLRSRYIVWSAEDFTLLRRA